MRRSSVAIVALFGLTTAAVHGQEFVFPSGLTIDPSGDVVLADRGAHYIFRIDIETGTVSVVAGTGREGFSGDGGLATRADLRNPEWVEYDHDGNLILADRGNHRVRMIRPDGTIQTIVGTGENEHGGDGGPALRARITNPFGLHIDVDGNLYVFDTEAHCVRRIDADGIISTVIGSRAQGFAGDGGPGTAAELYRPHNGVFAADGALVFGDSFNQRIRRWDPSTGVIRTIAGNGEEGPPRIGARAMDTPFMYFGGMVFNEAGDLLFTSLDHRIFAVDGATSSIRLVAGTGVQGFAGDGGPASRAQLDLPYGIAITASGDIVFSEAGNRRVRIIDAQTGIIRTLAGG